MFVDMAGDEKVASDPNVSLDRAKEGQNINLSLLELRRVLERLRINPKGVPFRGTVLTDIVQNYLKNENA